MAQEVGLIPAAVYGVVWRYCQGEKRVCYASLETMAEKLGINAATVESITTTTGQFGEQLQWDFKLLDDGSSQRAWCSSGERQ